MLRPCIITFIGCISFLQCHGQQRILLVGTVHRISEKTKRELPPVISTINKFRPDVICVEYLSPTDTASLRYRRNTGVYKDFSSMRADWNIQPGNLESRIQSLLKQLERTTDVSKRLELHNIFLIQSDFANSDYQAFIVMGRLARDSSQLHLLHDRPGFHELRRSVEERLSYMEYPGLVFPLAASMSISYLYPIDDLRPEQDSDNYMAALNETEKKSFDSIADAYKMRIERLPESSNELLWLNSQEAIGYSMAGLAGIRPWINRNIRMAMNIDAVARSHRGKNIVVFFGAGHIGIIREELNKLGQGYVVQTLNDVK